MFRTPKSKETEVKDYLKKLTGNQEVRPSQSLARLEIEFEDSTAAKEVPLGSEG